MSAYLAFTSCAWLHNDGCAHLGVQPHGKGSTVSAFGDDISTTLWVETPHAARRSAVSIQNDALDKSTCTCDRLSLSRTAAVLLAAFGAAAGLRGAATALPDAFGGALLGFLVCWACFIKSSRLRSSLRSSSLAFDISCSV